MFGISRRIALGMLSIPVLFPLSASAAEPTPTPESLTVYVGTYTGPKSEGIYSATLNLKTGELSKPKLAGKMVNPSFLAIHPTMPVLYAVGEVSDFQGKKAGGVAAFQIGESGALTLLNQQSSGGTGPCHVVVDAAGKNVLVANYGGGNASVLPIQDGGKLAAATGFVQHRGKSVNSSRQEAPHAHSINLDAANRFAFVADLGLDQVLIYRFDAAKGTITPNEPPFVKLADGAGPRHFAFHPNGKQAFVINELDSTITAMDYDAKSGTLTPTQTLSTLPQGKFPGNSTAEVVVHPSGKFVYGSNRGHNSIAGYAIAADGKLTALGNTQGKFQIPRNFAIDPTGQFLLACGQANHLIEVFRIDSTTGKLTATGSVVEVGSPVCVRFLRGTR
ncbi:lactonase family protein [Tuwongella immobilis]|uniref:6-phosphogluconolactonase n=1 Tax=Tuwongella immobilis TaxID=692036 RepID=A0A6C2YQA6_9BACT|nr:lactonase family protein [Tuwongella immobilis]VIP03501.1 6-phosphogluconolactonase : 3-carboxymuconate cyclase OS=Singulisphaera acidiphila (strain ATCC BAA-1392 / DSM 18658 / VKM B-2454 / MOB10) GN=Sinac_7043 PE=4 SV=1: Lactonase [Tuwongella immobilis]VTS04370.1 6-phosphogluconolactonase : 3-carboxymuconate cyclase OS=Singulisphaera acidiphila (strain ATCC BAA-1392 / DSM 18658 / VKM B-2454 / MOB10) GN=Sinac_7043 PE=4 SV=1: Lactonase [Tuwongella immobilis]